MIKWLLTCSFPLFLTELDDQVLVLGILHRLFMIGGFKSLAQVVHLRHQLLVEGSLATHTGPDLDVFQVSPSVHHLAYGLGRSVLGPRLVGRFRHVARAVAAARRQLDHRPALLIVTSRFVPGGRVTMNAACGTARLPLARFSPASAVAALAWATYTAGLGFVGGAAFVESPLLGLAVGIGLSFALGGAAELVRRRNRRTPGPNGSLTGTTPPTMLTDTTPREAEVR